MLLLCRCKMLKFTCVRTPPPPPPNIVHNIVYHKVVSWIFILKPTIPLFFGISQYYTMPNFSHQLVNSQQPAHENMKTTSSLFVWKRAIQINRFCKWNSDIRFSYSLALIVCCWITRGKILFHRSIKLFGRARGCRQGDCVSIVVDVVTAYEGLLL